METFNSTGLAQVASLAKVAEIDPFRIYTVSEAATIAEVSRQTIYNATQKQGVEKLNSGLCRRNGRKGIKGKDLSAWLNGFF